MPILAMSPDTLHPFGFEIYEGNPRSAKTCIELRAASKTAWFCHKQATYRDPKNESDPTYNLGGAPK